VHSGEILGLLGPSGAGKTSLLAILARQPHLLPKKSRPYGRVRISVAATSTVDSATASGDPPRTPTPLGRRDALSDDEAGGVPPRTPSRHASLRADTVDGTESVGDRDSPPEAAARPHRAGSVRSHHTRPPRAASSRLLSSVQPLVLHS
jgi:energy-coupling factor transporter ATP-binding protein EcfA2